MYESKETKRKKEIKEWIVSLLIVIVAVVIVRNFLFGTIVVKGVSMEPTFEHNDFVVINKLNYKIGEPERGEVVVCSYDKGTHEENIIKRVIGVPGDVIDIDMGQNYEYIVLVNGEAIDEPYLGENMEQKGDIDYPYTVPEGCYFVMGDNRNNSTDSRSKSIGAIEKNKIEGKVFVRLYPFNKFGTF